MSTDIRQTDSVGKFVQNLFLRKQKFTGGAANKKPPKRVLDFPRSRLCSGGLDHAPHSEARASCRLLL